MIKIKTVKIKIHSLDKVNKIPDHIIHKNVHELNLGFIRPGTF